MNSREGDALGSDAAGPLSGDTTDPLVSVVLPTYDRPEFLREAVESVCAQTYQPIELVVVDDCSPTPAEPVVDEVDTNALHNCRVIRHEVNRGGNAARNTGIRAATGAVVAFLDDDDRWTPGVVDAYVQAFADQPPDVGLVALGIETRDGRGRHLGTLLPSFGDDPVDSLLSGALVGSYSRFAVRRAVVDEAGLPDERLPSWQDWEWQFRLALTCRFAAVPEPLVIRREAGHGQITDDFVKREAVSYPLLLESLRPAMRARSKRDARRLVALLSRTLGHQAVATGRYGTGIRYLCRSLAAEPTNRQTYLYLFVALGGPVTYYPARLANRWLARVRRSSMRTTLARKMNGGGE